MACVCPSRFNLGLLSSCGTKQIVLTAAIAGVYVIEVNLNSFISSQEVQLAVGENFILDGDWFRTTGITTFQIRKPDTTIFEYVEGECTYDEFEVRTYIDFDASENIQSPQAIGSNRIFVVATYSELQALTLDADSIVYVQDASANLGYATAALYVYDHSSSSFDILGIGSLGDTEITAPSEGNVLVYRSGKWVNEAYGAVNNLASLGDVSITAPSNGQIIKYNNGNWENSEDEKDKYYKHTQGTVSASWTINHNLLKRPSVTVVDSGGNEVIGDVVYVDNNNLNINFSAPFSGYAELN